MNKIKFCDLSVLNITKKKKKVLSRNSVILDYHIGKTFYVHNGHKFLPILVSSRMKGYRFGEFCLTRKHFSHKNKK
jgi:small subunit ribosomal protein S19